MNYQRFEILGRFVRDPQLKYLANQTAVAEFGLAASRKFRTGAGEDKEETLFIDCECWGKQAEVIAQYMTKGKPIFAFGRLKLETWEAKEGGKRSKIIFTVEGFQFVGGKDNRDDAAAPSDESDALGITGGAAPRKTAARPQQQRQAVPDDETPW